MFNPVKQEEDGKKARRVIWSTESINLALKGIQQGRRLVANPFYENNTKLLKADLVFERTPEEIEEWKKCKNDIIYFCNKYCKLMTPKGIQHIQLRDYQDKYLKHLQKYRLSIMISCRQAGKSITSAMYMLHYLCFNTDKNMLITGDKRSTACEILDKLKKIFMELPYFLRPGVNKWNEGQIVTDNGCMILAQATTINSGISYTFHCVLLDEFAHVSPNILDKFYNQIYPTVAASKAKLMITSTQNGYNLFYRLYTAATQGDSEYKAFKVDWYDVPEWNPEKQCWEKRDEKWHKMQVANLGGEENFNKQFGTSFDISAPTLISQANLREYQKDLREFVRKDLPGVVFSDMWYWDPDIDPTEDLKKEFIVITCDLAEGLGRDYTIFSLYKYVNPTTLKPSSLQCIGFFRSNELDRDRSALSLCLLQCKYLNQDYCLLSYEKNTYGELFGKQLRKIGDDICSDWDPATVVNYPQNESKTKQGWGIKITSSNKTPHCILFKEDWEKGRIINKSTIFAGELINFCDDGTKHFSCSYGHDDLVMSAIQLEFVKETLQYTTRAEDISNEDVLTQDDNFWNPYDISNTTAKLSPIDELGGDNIYKIDQSNNLNRLK